MPAEDQKSPPEARKTRLWQKVALGAALAGAAFAGGRSCNPKPDPLLQNISKTTGFPINSLRTIASEDGAIGFYPDPSAHREVNEDISRIPGALVQQRSEVSLQDIQEQMNKELFNSNAWIRLYNSLKKSPNTRPAELIHLAGNKPLILEFSYKDSGAIYQCKVGDSNFDLDSSKVRILHSNSRDNSITIRILRSDIIKATEIEQKISEESLSPADASSHRNIQLLLPNKNINLDLRDLTADELKKSSFVGSVVFDMLHKMSFYKSVPVNTLTVELPEAALKNLDDTNVSNVLHEIYANFTAVSTGQTVLKIRIAGKEINCTYLDNAADNNNLFSKQWLEEQLSKAPYQSPALSPAGKGR